MKQTSLGLPLSSKRTRKRAFLDAREWVVPWRDLVALIEPFAPEGGRQRQFGHVKVGDRGLAKNPAQLQVLFALSNPWMVRQA